MKKLLACGLILSTLMSMGSVCFAWGDGYNGEGIENSQSTKEPKEPRGDKEDKKPKRKYKKSAAKAEKEKLKDLRNQAMALLNNYYEEGYFPLGYLYREIVEMRIGNLNDICTVLTVNGQSQDLPEYVAKALYEYLVKRKDLIPNTMGKEQPLFIDCSNPKQGLPMNVGGVNAGICQYHKANGEPAYMEEE